MSDTFENHKDKRIKEIHERFLNFKIKKKQQIK
jgi:hypothetical protein